MLPFWRTFRLALFLFVFVVLGIYLGFTTPWRRLFGPRPDFAALLRSGDPLVAAIYRFHADTALWPEYLDDLAPKYLPASPPATWYFTLTPDGPSLATTVDADQTHVGYTFDLHHPAWRVFGYESPRTLRDDTASPTTHPAPPPENVRTENELAELDRRITREPRLLEHRRDKASLLLSLHRTDDARQVLQQAAADFPDAAWPRLALAAIDPTPDAIAAFAAWNTDHPAFTHDYDLFLLYRRTHDDPHALAAIHHALTLPIELAPDDTHILPFYLFDMARYALAHKQYALVLQITNAWQKQSAAHRIEENSYLPLRAAAELALGHPADAQKDLALLDTLKTPTWASNLHALQQAVDRGDTRFAYDPGNSPSPFDIFPLPQ
ncbi:MAG: tetratricopeptide repeat protein [Phycisphaerae bacterium]